MNFAGQVHLYYGDGQGKTSAAVGLAVRAFGAGFDVLLVQFLKDGHSPEMDVLRDRIGIPVLAEQCTRHMSFCMTEEEKEQTRACHEHIWQAAMDWACHKGAPAGSSGCTEFPAGRLLILDEILGAVEAGLFPESHVFAFLDSRPADLEVVLTGRNPSPGMLDRASYLSKITCVSHPYDRGIQARKGIEF